MHLASRAAGTLYDSLQSTCSDVPSRGYVESLLRMTGLLHDVGHGPFGHFFDDHYLRQFNLTHEILGKTIICDELGDLLKRLRRNPNSELAANEQLDPRQIAWLMTRPTNQDDKHPQWLRFLRSLLSGIYTIDNLDFVLRDAYMSGYSQRSFDLDRLLHYTFFSNTGLTIHDRGVDALLRFMASRAELFRSIYFHRTVRAIDMTLQDLFTESMRLVLPGNPLDHLDEYLHFTESALLVDVSRWQQSKSKKKQELGKQWKALLARQLRWKMICQRNLVFTEDDAEQSSVFSDASLVEKKVRDHLPPHLANVPLRIDIARHIHRPHTRGPSSGQNFLYDSARDSIRPLSANELYDRLPVSHRICRIYAETDDHRTEMTTALDELIGGRIADDLTNM